MFLCPKILPFLCCRCEEKNDPSMTLIGEHLHLEAPDTAREEYEEKSNKNQ